MPVARRLATRAAGWTGGAIGGNRAIGAAVTVARRVSGRCRAEGEVTGAGLAIAPGQGIFRLRDVPCMAAREAEFLR